MKKFKIFKCTFLFIFVFIFSFHSLFYVPVEAEAPIISGTASMKKLVAGTSAYNFNVYGFDYFTNFKTYFDNNLESGCFYKIRYNALMEVKFDKDGKLNAADLNFEFYKSTGPTESRVNLIQQIEVMSCASNTPYQLTDSGYMIVYADDISHTYYAYQFNFNYTGQINVLTYDVNLKLDIMDVIKLSESEAEIYQRAYAEGFADGEEQGFADGKGQGQNIGYGLGYEDGYDEGFDAGFDSVDVDQYYQNGYQAGVDSIDTESIYQNGYQDGLNSGYQDAYEQGFSFGCAEGYKQGYAAAQQSFKENVEAGGVSEGESSEIVIDLDLQKSDLKLSESNVTLGTVYEFNADEDVTHIYDVEEDFDYLSGSLYDNDDDALNDEVVLDFSTITKYYEKTYTDSFNSYRGWSYYYTGNQKLFTADPETYAYKISVTPLNIGADYTNINWFRHTVGTRSDIMAGTSEIGIGMISGYSDEFTYMITTDNLPVDIYSAFLMYFYNEGTKDVHNYAAYDVSGKLKIVITPFSRNEYAAIMSGMDDIQNDINNRFEELEENLDQNFDELMNSYDDSAGNAANDQLATSLNDFTVAEESLFEKAQEGISSYEFFDFNSFPVLVTGLSFVSSLMSSVYFSMGGNNGPMGIVLSVTFSVILVSMAVGLYRYFSGSGKGDGD